MPDLALSKQLAYITCELADQALRDDDRWNAQKLAKEALQHDRSCIRATLILVSLQRRSGNFRDASQTLLKVFDQNPEFGPEPVLWWDRDLDADEAAMG